MENFDNYIPTRLLFGPGKLEALKTERLPGHRALIVISSGKSVRANGVLDRVQTLLEANGVSCVIYDRIQPNPIKEHVMEAAAIARREKCDFVLGLGGGSSIDSAKAIAIMATNPGDYWDYVSGGSGKARPLCTGPLPIVAITTTAGTGTEVDPWMVITNGEEKIGFGSTMTFPVLAIVDPELMLTVPPRLTAYQGFDALFHAAEGYLATIATPISELYSLKAIELIAESLPTAVAEGGNLAARTNVALANTLAGMVESTSCCTSEHSLAHAIGGLFPAVPHGAALLMVSDAWFRFFETRVPERCATMARALGAESFSAGLARLRQLCGVADLALSEFGITRDDLPAINANARETMGGLFKLDRYELSPEESLAILEAPWR